MSLPKIMPLAETAALMFAPEAEYERQGDVQDVVFPCGYAVAADGDTINLDLGRCRFEYCFGARQHSLSLELAGRRRTPEHSGDRRYK
jgi:hypothetical protein